MRRRINQFIAALTARLSGADRDFVAAWLTPAEQLLFYGMNLPDQRHSLDVAYTARTLAHGRPDVDLPLLTSCALLHDIGKVKGDVSTFDKTVTVLAHRFAPGWAATWGRPGRGGRLANLRHAFHVYFHHPARSAALLAASGAGQRLIAIIERHHRPPAPADPPELELLRAADDMN